MFFISTTSVDKNFSNILLLEVGYCFGKFLDTSCIALLWNYGRIASSNANKVTKEAFFWWVIDKILITFLVSGTQFLIELQPKWVKSNLEIWSSFPTG